MILPLFHFVYTTLFDETAPKAGLSDELIESLETTLRENPMAGDLVPGAGGVRKVRVELPRKKRGKSGGARVIFYHRSHVQTIYLVFAYGKDVAEDLSEAGKKVIREMIRKLEKE